MLKHCDCILKNKKIHDSILQKKKLKKNDQIKMLRDEIGKKINKKKVIKNKASKNKASSKSSEVVKTRE